MKFKQDDPKIIWIAPSESNTEKGEETGSYHSPFRSMRRALPYAQPGSSIVLQPGEYYEDVTFHLSGAITDPIYISSETGTPGSVVCKGSWFFYDPTDLIVSGILFDSTKYQSISVLGTSERNNFGNLHFKNCGLHPDSLCTFFMGGACGSSNVVENCTFEITNSTSSIKPKHPDLPVGIMITEGDIDGSNTPNCDYVFRNNRFSHYGCAFIIGTRDVNSYFYNHLVENNHISSCTSDGIRVKCSEIIIRNNSIKDCASNGITIKQGRGHSISNNRLENCGIGIYIGEPDCTVSNNCIINSVSHAIKAQTTVNNDEENLGTILIEKNSCINSGNGKQSIIDIMLHTKSFCILQNNLFYSPESGENNNKREAFTSLFQQEIYSIDNCASNSYSTKNGCKPEVVTFSNSISNDFTSYLSYGAKGWMTTPSEADSLDMQEEPGPLNNMSQSNIECDPKEVAGQESSDPKELYVKSLFLSAEETIMDEESQSLQNCNDQTESITDFSTWDE